MDSDHNNIVQLRQAIQKKGLSMPWRNVYGKSLDDLQDSDLREIFMPWEIFFGAKMTYRFIADKINEKKQGVGIKALDVGCGAGNLCRFLSKATVAEIEGCDIDHDAIQCANVLSDLYQASIQYRHGNFFKSAFLKIENYDVIILNSVLEHIIEYEDWIKRIYNLLKPDGYAIIIVPSILGAWSLLHDMDYRKMGWKAQPYNYHPGMHCNHFWFSQLRVEFLKNKLNLYQVYKTQAFSPLIILPFQLIKRGWSLFHAYTKLDYYLSKILPVDIATRVIVFKK